MSVKISAFVGVMLALVLTIASGAMTRSMNGQWSSADEMNRLAPRLDSLPVQFGAWRLADTKELGEFAEQTLQCAGYLNHTYVHEETRQLVNVAVLLGPPGPVSVHTPEICYSSRDYTRLGERKAVASQDGGQLWSLKFQANGVDASKLLVFYGWTVDGTWEAVENPRFEFARKPYLFKLQMAAESSGDEATDDICQEFLRDFLSILHQHVFDEVGS